MSSETELAPISDGGLVHPIVVDLGKQRRKRIKELKRGSGKLMEEVAAALEQVRNSLSEAERGQVLLPVVFVYRQKRKRSKSLGLPFGF